MQSPRGDANDTDTKTRVHESVIQVAALKHRHPTVLSRLAVEDQVGGQDSSTDNGRAVQEALGEIAPLRLVGGLHVRATERILEGLSGLREDRVGTERLRLERLEGRVVNESSGIGGLGDLAESRSHGEGASEEERHDCRTESR